MNKDIYNIYSHKIKEWIPPRENFDDPLDQALQDVFVFFPYSKEAELRKSMIEMIDAGYLKYREELPQYDVDLVCLTDKGIDYIKLKLDFAEL